MDKRDKRYTHQREMYAKEGTDLRKCLNDQIMQQYRAGGQGTRPERGGQNEKPFMPGQEISTLWKSKYQDHSQSWQGVCVAGCGGAGQ